MYLVNLQWVRTCHLHFSANFRLFEHFVHPIHHDVRFSGQKSYLKHTLPTVASADARVERVPSPATGFNATVRSPRPEASNPLLPGRHSQDLAPGLVA